MVIYQDIILVEMSGYISVRPAVRDARTGMQQCSSHIRADNYHAAHAHARNQRRPRSFEYLEPLALQPKTSDNEAVHDIQPPAESH